MTGNQQSKTNLDVVLSEARNEIFIKKNFSSGIELLTSVECPETELHELLAFAYLENKQFANAANEYDILQKPYQQGLCELLQGNEYKARNLWYNAQENSVIQWAQTLYGFIHLRADRIPSYLQIRNYLEVDLGYLLKANQIEYAENLISCEDVMADINLETYKFIGRALFNNGYENLSVEFFMKSRDILPNDPEVYYHLAQYSFKVGSFRDVKLMAESCLDINKNYFPAKRIIELADERLKASRL